MKRELIETNGSGEMAVVDMYTDLFMRPVFVAGVIVTEMRPATICHQVGRFNTRQEAVTAALAAFSQTDGKTP